MDKFIEKPFPPLPQAAIYRQKLQRMNLEQVFTKWMD
jgi:hypothetical protein